MKASVFIFLVFPLVLYAAWKPQCWFVVQQSDSSKVKLRRGSVGNLVLIPCFDVTPSLPNYNWLKQTCSQYATSAYPKVLLEGDSSASECRTLADQKLILYSSLHEYSSIRNTPSSLLPDKPVLMRFPSDFQINARINQ